jgi:hypothetical protein
VSKNQYIIYMLLLVLFVVLAGTGRGAPTMNIYQFWDMLTR